MLYCRGFLRGGWATLFRLIQKKQQLRRKTLKEMYTLAVMSPDGRSVRQYSVGSWALKLLCVLLCGIIMGAFGGVGYGVLSKISLKTVEFKNDALKQQAEALQMELDSLKEEVSEIRRMADKVRSALGIDARSEGLLGQGGDGADTNQAADSEPDSKNAGGQANPIPTLSSAVETGSLSVRIAAAKGAMEPTYAHVMKELKKLDETPSVLPILTTDDGQGKVFWYASGFGYRTHPTTRRREFHRGLDIATRKGTPVIASAHGIVGRFGYDKLLGNMVKIKHPSTGMETLYGHLSRFADGIRRGKKVARGEIIGYVGSSGRSTGNHLHYGIAENSRWINPMGSIIGFWSP